MGPGRLRQILDGDGDLLIALDEQDVAGLERSPERFRVGGCERLVAARFRLKNARQPLAGAIKRIVDKTHARRC